MSATAVAVKAWLADVLGAAKKSPRTVEAYAAATDKFFDYLAQAALPTQLEDLKPAHVRSFLANSESKRNSLANYDRALRAIFGRIEREGIEDFGLPDDWRNPFGLVQRVVAEEREKVPLSVEQARRLLAAAPKRGFLAARNYAQLSTMLLIGLRASEICQAKLEDLDLAARTLRVRGKGNRFATVFLPAKLTRILLAYLARRGDRGALLFPTRAGMLQHRRSIHRMVRCAGKRIGLASLHPHLLRHSFVSISLNVHNAPLKFVQNQARHRDVKTTMKYSHVLPEEGHRLADKFATI